jgi:protein-S-isoprenylcysteine O-methyltransferase Ste14
VPSAVCFWLAARKDVANNIKKFGADYEEYMNKVPMWNVFKGLRKLK